MTQDEQSRVQRIKQYVLARLRDELATAPRGAQAQLAKKLGVSGAHLSNMLSTSPSRQPGEDFRRKVAAHWGITYAQLEALAFGEEAPESTAKPVVQKDSPAPGPLVTAALEYRWLPDLPEDMRIVVREQARQYHRFGRVDLTADEWRRVITGLEREALAFLAWRTENAAESKPGKKRTRTR